MTLNRKCKSPLFYQTLFGNGKSNGRWWPWETELSTLNDPENGENSKTSPENPVRIYLIDNQLNFALEFTYSNNTSNNNSSTGSFSYIV